VLRPRCAAGRAPPLALVRRCRMPARVLSPQPFPPRINHEDKIPFLLLSISLAGGALRADEAAPSESGIAITGDLIGRLAAEAQGRNPAIEAAGARADAASEAVESVRIWEDPVFSFGLWFPGQQGFTSSEMGNIVYGVEQKLPVFGARNWRETSRSRQPQRRSSTFGLRPRRSGEISLWPCLTWRLPTRTQDWPAGQAWLDATLAAVDDRYRVGKSSQVEWLKIQTERAKGLINSRPSSHSGGASGPS